MFQFEEVKGENKGDIKLFAISTCVWCKRTKRLLESLGVNYNYIFVDKLDRDTRSQVEEEVKKPEPKTVTLAEVKAGDPDVNVKARIKNLFNAREFERNGSKGKVRNAVITDGTNEIRLVLWNNQADLPLTTNQAIIVEHAYTKDSENPVTGENRLELHVSSRGNVKPTTTNIPSLGTRKRIEELKEGDQNVELRAVVVQVFPPTLIKVCPKCGVMNANCSCNAGDRPSLILNAVLDDGSGNIRAVFFRELGEAVLGITGQDLARDQNSPNDAMNNLNGLEKVFFGSVKRNDYNNEKELVVRGFENVDVEKEMKR